MEFSHKGKIYKIRRNPTYEKYKKFKEGTTTKVGDAVIETQGKPIVSGYKAVTDKVIELLGVTANQFKQIVMLAQR